MKPLKNTKGFTLIEVIIALVLTAIAGAMLVSYFQTGLTQSANPLTVLNDNFMAIQGIERVHADYRSRLSDNPDLDISIYHRANLSSLVDGLTGVGIKGEGTRFSTPDANRKVSEIAGDDGQFVRITATKNNCTLVTLIGN